MSLVCSAFKNEVWHCYRHVDLRALQNVEKLRPGDLASKVYSKTVNKILQSSSPTFTRSLILSNFHILTSNVSGALFSLVAQRTALTSLDLGCNCTNSLDDSAAVVNILDTLPYLRSVSIAPLRDGWSLFTRLKCLKSVTFHYPADLDGLSLPQVEYLHFRTGFKGHGETLGPFLSTCTKLRSIEFSSVFRVFWVDCVIKMREKMPELHHITFTTVNCSCNELLLKLASKPFPSLESISMIGYIGQINLNNAALSEFCSLAGENLKQLTKLVLPALHEINCDLLKNLTQISKLRVLGGVDWKLDSSVIQTWFASSWSDTLQTLDITTCRDFKMSYIEEIIKGARGIVEIKVFRPCTSSEAEELRKIQKQYQHVLISY